ncbi:uncharacterized protein LOC108737049 [Agrilus planipennis]|uniref:Uncharacterized protein LOC108737049 n=1 Tax=Agrilus planipennis TaxID=224129 RepID=A0A1W4WMR5_AGRPL|nr:uncharacterized protein LOC108737049 [Agrilus planipennis]XP_018325210.1 uncharacterized protein LOC108737049 [Agrilus planipennis]
MGMDMDDMEGNFFKYLYIILAVVGVFILLAGIIICCRLRNRSTKSTIIYGSPSVAGGQGVLTTQSVYHQYGTANRQIPVSHGTPMMGTQPSSNVSGFPNPYSNYSPQTYIQSPPYPTGNEFPQIPQQSQPQAVSTPHYNIESKSNPQFTSAPPYTTNETCNSPPSYEEVQTEGNQKQPAYNPNFTNNSGKY